MRRDSRPNGYSVDLQARFGVGERRERLSRKPRTAPIGTACFSPTANSFRCRNFGPGIHAHIPVLLENRAPEALKRIREAAF